MHTMVTPTVSSSQSVKSDELIDSLFHRWQLGFDRFYIEVVTLWLISVLFVHMYEVIFKSNTIISNQNYCRSVLSNVLLYYVLVWVAVNTNRTICFYINSAMTHTLSNIGRAGSALGLVWYVPFSAFTINRRYIKQN